MMDFLHRKNLYEIISDMATDEISIRAITRNKCIRDSMKRYGFKLPVNESGVMRLIHDDFEDKKIKMIREMESKIDKGKKLSVILDENTTVRRRRFWY